MSHRVFRRALSTPARTPLANFAFALDIDGVLMRGKHPVPGAAEALTLLNAHSVPWVGCPSRFEGSSSLRPASFLLAGMFAAGGIRLFTFTIHFCIGFRPPKAFDF